MNNILSQILHLYTKFASAGFAKFGKGGVIKPILNSSNQKHISIGSNVNIGMNCRITVSTEFGGYTTKSKNKIRLSLGDHVDVGNNAFISASNCVSVGSHVIMSPYVFITDHDHSIEDITKNLHQQPISDDGFVKIEDNVLLGTKCSILKNVTVGQHSAIGANSVVTHDVPAYSVAVGNPARVIKHYDFKAKKWVKNK